MHNAFGDVSVGKNVVIILGNVLGTFCKMNLFSELNITRQNIRNYSQFI